MRKRHVLPRGSDPRMEEALQLAMLRVKVKALLEEAMIDEDYIAYCAHLDVLHTVPTREEHELYEGMEIDEYEF